MPFVHGLTEWGGYEIMNIPVATLSGGTYWSYLSASESCVHSPPALKRILSVEPKFVPLMIHSSLFTMHYFKMFMNFDDLLFIVHASMLFIPFFPLPFMDFVMLIFKLWECTSIDIF